MFQRICRQGLHAVELVHFLVERTGESFFYEPLLYNKSPLFPYMLKDKHNAIVIVWFSAALAEEQAKACLQWVTLLAPILANRTTEIVNNRYPHPFLSLAIHCIKLSARNVGL